MLEIQRPTEPSVYYKAEAFHITAKLLYDNPELKYQGAPFIVNACFSLELYLKSLISKTIFDEPEIHKKGYTSYRRVYSKSTHKGPGHNLANLYHQLPKDDKLELEKIHLETNSTLPLANFFEKYKNHFTNWRYSFEGSAEPYCAADVLNALETLKKYASKRGNPDSVGQKSEEP